MEVVDRHLTRAERVGQDREGTEPLEVLAGPPLISAFQTDSLRRRHLLIPDPRTPRATWHRPWREPRNPAELVQGTPHARPEEPTAGRMG